MDDHFAKLADEFIIRVKASSLSPTAEVTLIYKCVDQQGKELAPIRTSLTPTTTVRGFQQEAGQAFARSVHIDTIIGNINSLVRNPPKGLVMLRDAPQIPLRVVDFEMEIVDFTK